MVDIVLPYKGQPDWDGTLNSALANIVNAVNNLPADAKNPESDLYASILQVAKTVSPSGVPVFYTATTLNDARPTTQAGQAVWWTVVSTNPLATPVNIANGDKVFVVSPAPMPFDFNQLQGYAGDYDARTLIGSVADGGALTAYSWPDLSGNGRSLTVASGTNLTNTPVFDADAFGAVPDVPGVVFPSRSGVQYNPGTPIASPTNVLLAANVRFRDVGTAATETLNTFGSTPYGRYSISRVGATGSQYLQMSNADATGYYQSSQGDYTGELSIVASWTPNGQKMWVNGTQVLNHTEATPVSMPQMASFRIGYVSTSSDTGLVKAAIDSRVNRFVWATPTDSSYVTTELVGTITSRLVALR